MRRYEDKPAYRLLLQSVWAYPQVGRSGAGGSVLHRGQSHDAEECPSGNSAAGAVPDDQLLLHVFGLHATDAGRVDRV